jgi:hypothetical protein
MHQLNSNIKGNNLLKQYAKNWLKTVQFLAISCAITLLACKVASAYGAAGSYMPMTSDPSRVTSAKFL